MSLRTVERAVAPLRQALRAEARATIRFETAPGEQLQVGSVSAAWRSTVCVRRHRAEGWFQGMSSSRRVILWSGMRARVSASQASGSAPQSLAVSIRV